MAISSNASSSRPGWRNVSACNIARWRRISARKVSQFRALGQAGAGFLKREIERGDNKVIGLGHGRTLSSAVHHMPRLNAKGLRFVSMLGGLSRNYVANPYDVMHRIAEKTGAHAYVMPVPFFANTGEDREVMLAQRGVKEVFDLANNADLKLVGLGTVDTDAQLVLSGMVEPREIAEIAASGGVGEILGHFFDADGRILETTLTARTLSASLPRSKTERLVALGRRCCEGRGHPRSLEEPVSLRPDYRRTNRPGAFGTHAHHIKVITK